MRLTPHKESPSDLGGGGRQYECRNCCTEWDDVWDSQPDDDCPDCGLTISPHHSEDVPGWAESMLEHLQQQDGYRAHRRTFDSIVVTMDEVQDWGANPYDLDAWYDADGQRGYSIPI